jgi:hypothetical protein
MQTGAPAGHAVSEREPLTPLERRRWWWCCAFTLIPLTAMLHHAVFRRPTCMLKGFGPDYDPSTLLAWLAQDPSLPWALVLAGSVYAAGLGPGPFPRLVRLLAAPFASSFIPLALWIWDIPLSRRWVCRSFHDERLVLPLLGPLHSWHLYLLGLTAYALALTRAVIRERAR